MNQFKTARRTTGLFSASKNLRHGKSVKKEQQNVSTEGSANSCERDEEFTRTERQQLKPVYPTKAIEVDDLMAKIMKLKQKQQKIDAGFKKESETLFSELEAIDQQNSLLKHFSSQLEKQVQEMRSDARKIEKHMQNAQNNNSKLQNFGLQKKRHQRKLNKSKSSRIFHVLTAK